MGKFNKTGKRGMPELNTSSLPDLIFTMLFFFMIPGIVHRHDHSKQYID